MRIWRSIQARLQRANASVAHEPIEGPAAQIRPRLQALLCGLESQLAHIDERFVALSGDLRDTYSVASGLGQQMNERVTRLRDGLGGGCLEELTATAQRRLRARLQATEKRLQRLVQIRQELMEVRTDAEQLSRASSYLQLLALNFGVESARLETQQEAFGAFVQELRALAQQIGEVAAGIMAHVDGAASAQAEGIQLLNTHLAQLQRITADLDCAGRDTVAEAQALLQAALETLQTSARCSQELATQANEAVYHLQAGDILRQQSEHVAAALRDAIGRLQEQSSATDVTVADHILGIQIEQLHVIRSEVGLARQRVQQAFGGMGGAAEELGAAVHRWQARVQACDGQQDVMARLLQDVTRLEAVQEQGERLYQEATDRAAHAATHAGALSDFVRRVGEVTQQLHLQSLNAIVKSAALGQAGATLEVLAMQVHAQHLEAEASAQAVIGHVRAIVGDDATSAADVRSVETRDERAVVERVAPLRDELHALVAVGATALEEQRQSLERSVANLGFLEEVEKASEARIVELEELRRVLAPACQKDALAADAMEGLARQYTMASERAAHARAKRSANERAEDPGTGESGPPAAVVTAGASPSEFGDNVELF